MGPCQELPKFSPTQEVAVGHDMTRRTRSLPEREGSLSAYIRVRHRQHAWVFIAVQHEPSSTPSVMGIRSVSQWVPELKDM